MKMNNFIQLINNLNQDFSFYLQIEEKKYPLSKVTFTANECLLNPGKRVMTKKALFKLIRKIHHRDIAIYIIKNNKKLPVYGIQVVIDQKIVILK